ncbi:MAG: DNA cytosine methyltransferase [Gammaproteobacteria bacterium]|nr:DNA cytosine methyltransferase [Gammaproteobacteria bacterium]
MNNELIIDSFAGGGGASIGLENALGRPVDVAINHDPQAISLHERNHPHTRHYCESVWDVDPLEVTKGRPVGLAWFSPDCTHFSKAKGGKPVKKEIRGLAWIVLRWAAKARPRIIMLENVEEFADWGPLTRKRSRDRHPQPCKHRKGNTFDRWWSQLEALGYRIEKRELRACDYGAPTIRKRLFIIARRDRRPIVWPEPTHGAPDSPEVLAGQRLPWRTAAECIDWTQPCPSIFLSPEEARPLGIKRPLADATMKRIAKGVQRFILDAAEPFIVTANHGGDGFRGQGLDEPFKTITAARDAHGLVSPAIVPIQHYGRGETVHSADEPLRTITAYPKGGSFSLVAAHMMKFRGQSAGNPATDPLATITAGSHHSRPAGAPHALGVCQAFLAQHNLGAVGHRPDKPLSTITGKGSQQQLVTCNMMTNTTGHPGSACDLPTPVITSRGNQFLVASHLLKLRGDTADRNSGQAIDTPLPTITAAGTHVAEVRAFLLKYYGQGNGQDPREPLHTITARDRMGLVTVEGTDYQIVDIGMRMLQPRELYRAQGFPDWYEIDTGADGQLLPKHAQVRMVGNSVSPVISQALAEANYLVGVHRVRRSA